MSLATAIILTILLIIAWPFLVYVKSYLQMTAWLGAINNRPINKTEQTNGKKEEEKR